MSPLVQKQVSTATLNKCKNSSSDRRVK